MKSKCHHGNPRPLVTCCLPSVHSALRIASFQPCLLVLRGNKADLLSGLTTEFFKEEISVEIRLLQEEENYGLIFKLSFEWRLRAEGALYADFD